MFSNFLASKFSGWAFIILIVALLGVFGYIYGQGYTACKADIVTKEAKIDDKRNEIANNRPDTAAFFSGLLDDLDW